MDWDLGDLGFVPNFSGLLKDMVKIIPPLSFMQTGHSDTDLPCKMLQGLWMKSAKQELGIFVIFCYTLNAQNITEYVRAFTDLGKL